MFDFFVQNWGSLLVAAILAAAVIAVILTLKRNRKKGGSSCGCHCGQCPVSGVCHTKPQK